MGFHLNAAQRVVLFLSGALLLLCVNALIESPGNNYYQIFIGTTLATVAFFLCFKSNLRTPSKDD